MADMFTKTPVIKYAYPISLLIVVISTLIGLNTLTTLIVNQDYHGLSAAVLSVLLIPTGQLLVDRSAQLPVNLLQVPLSAAILIVYANVDETMAPLSILLGFILLKIIFKKNIRLLILTVAWSSTLMWLASFIGYASGLNDPVFNVVMLALLLTIAYPIDIRIGVEIRNYSQRGTFLNTHLRNYFRQILYNSTIVAFTLFTIIITYHLGEEAFLIGLLTVLLISTIFYAQRSSTILRLKTIGETANIKTDPVAPSYKQYFSETLENYQFVLGCRKLYVYIQNTDTTWNSYQMEDGMLIKSYLTNDQCANLLENLDSKTYEVNYLKNTSKEKAALVQYGYSRNQGFYTDIEKAIALKNLENAITGIQGATELGLNLNKETQRGDRNLATLSDISHELKNPLAAVSGYAELLAVMLKEDEKKAKYAKNIKKAAGRMDAILTNLSLLAKEDAGKLILNKTAMHVDDFIVKAAEDWHTIYPDLNLSIQVDSSPDIEEGLVQILADEIKIRQLLDNLLSNASKAVKAQGFVALTVKYDEENEKLLLTMFDTGYGIPQDQLKLIGERFYRSSTSKQNGSEGTGIGMSVCHAIVKEHKGTMVLTSKEGKWTKVELSIPSGT